MAVTRYDLGSEYTGGFPAPTQEEAEAEMIPIATVDSVGDPSLRYAPADEVIVADGTLSAALAPLLRGTGLTVDSSGRLRPRLRPRAVQVSDHFISGGLTSGSIGALGWSLLGTATPTLTRPGGSLTTASKTLLSTDVNTNDRACLTLANAEASDILGAAQFSILQCCWRHPVLTDRRVFFGLMGTFATEPSAAVDCLGIYHDSAVGASYRIIARASSAGSPVDTGVAAPDNVIELVTIWQPVAGTYQFYSGNTLIGTISSGAPVAACNVGFRLETLTGSAKTLNVNYFGLDADATSAYDDDAFLEV